MKTKSILTLGLLLGLLFLVPTHINAQKTMPRLIQLGNEIIRVNPEKPSQIQYSTSGGRMWSSRYTGSSCGTFQTLMDNGNELLAQTDKGLYYSTSSGRMWSKRR